MRLIVSGLWNKNCFKAAFEHEFDHLRKPLFAVAMAGLLLSVFPCLFACAYTIWLIQVWGYEIKVLSIEAIILAVVICALELYQFIQQLKG